MKTQGKIQQKQVSELPEAEAEKLSLWAEKLEETSFRAHVNESHGPEAGRAFLEGILGKAEVDRVAGRGRPALGAAGVSPTRTVRLPRELDDALVARAKVEHRRPSEIMRDALSTYLRAS